MRTGFPLFIAYGCLAVSLFGQAPEFDAASIKPNPSLPLMKIGPGFGAGRLSGVRVTLRDLVMSAYDMTYSRVIGPGWLDGDRFDVIAKAPESTSKDDLRAMLQTLLKERFHLEAHLETREMPVYDLVVAKGGVKMAKHGAPGSDGSQPRKKYPDVRNVATFGGTFTTAQIAYFLSGEHAAGRPVLDKTGLEGKYDFFLTYMANLPTTAVEAPDLGPPDLFAAIEDVMGLRLQPSKAELSVVVVDHMDRKPTEN